MNTGRRSLTSVLGIAAAAAAVIATIVPPAAAEPVGRRYALLIGVSTAIRPGVPRLNFVDNDLDKLREMLQREDYEVATVDNDRADRRRILEQLYSHALRLTERDTFLLYYAGHGVRNIEVNRKTYWLTSDAEISMLDVQGIRLEHLLTYVDDIRAGRKLILLDHCYSGDVEGLRLMTNPSVETMAAAAVGAAAAATAATPPPAPSPSGPIIKRHASVVVDLNSELKAHAETEGTAVLAAARDEAYELRAFRHGVFTKALLDACSMVQGDNKDLKRSILELIRFVKPHVATLLKDANAPTQTVVDRVAGSAGGLDWYFCTVQVPKAEVAARAGNLGAAIQAWETKGLLSPERRVACQAVLDKWKAAAGDLAALSLPENRILTGIRLFADSEEAAPEQARADALNDVLERMGF